MLHGFRYLLQLLRGKGGLQTLLLVIYAIAFFQLVHSEFVLHGAFDPHVFFGMFRLSDDPNIPNLTFNVSSVVFMAFGLALPLGRFSNYLMVPESMVYVRKGKGAAHFLAYLALVAVYCMVFAGVQLVLTAFLVRGIRISGLLAGAVCAALILMALMLLADAGYLLGNGVLGYLAAALAYGVVLSLGSFDAWLLASRAGSVPHWVPVVVLAVVALASADAVLFRRHETY